MEKEVILTKRFLRDLENVYEYLLTNWSAKIAFDFLIKVEGKIKTIRRYPESGRPSTQKRGVMSIEVKPHNRIYFRQTDLSVRILALIDMRQSPSKNPY